MRVLALLAVAATIGGCVTARAPRLRSAAEGKLIARQSGLYLTADDFDAGHLVGAVACESDSRPVDRDAFGKTATVTWVGATPATQYAKSEIFGFRACDGTDVRFVRGANFRVVRAPPFYLYQHEYRVSMGKSGSRLVASYAFSRTAADSVRPLTLDALKRAYPENHRFHDVLDLAFRRDEELMRFDEFHHEYRVARLLRETLEQTLISHSQNGSHTP